MRALKSWACAVSVVASVSPAVAQECLLDVVESVDAVGAELSYYTDSDLLQAVLVSYHRYDDGGTLIAVSPTACEDGRVNRCIGVTVEGLLEGQDRTFWHTEILRVGEQVTVNTEGFQDLERTQPVPEGRYTDVFSVRRCSG